MPCIIGGNFDLIASEGIAAKSCVKQAYPDADDQFHESPRHPGSRPRCIDGSLCGRHI